MVCEQMICFIMDDVFIIDHLGPCRDTHAMALNFS